MSSLFPRLADPDDGAAITVAGTTLTYRQLRDAAAVVAAAVHGLTRVAVWAETRLETCVAAVGAIAAGVPILPVNPRAGANELRHVAANSTPDRVLAAPGSTVTGPLAAVERLDVGLSAAPAELLDELGDEDTMIVIYTSGTTGLPKGVQIPRRAFVSNQDALAEAWAWTADDRVTHALPLFHAHGLLLGVLGTFRRGAHIELVERFSPAALGAAVARGATMVLGVPTMYHRIADEAENDPGLARSFAGPRLLLSGSSALPAAEHQRFERLTGQRVVERYGMTETQVTVTVRADGERLPGYVGVPVPGVELRLVDEAGAPQEIDDDETVGEVEVRGATVFKGYLNRPEETREAFRDGWFRTGDLATRAANGYLRIVGRSSTDLIKSGGYRIGAGEVEAALLEHPGVAEVAVAGRPDDDLGERVAAWIVPAAGAAPTTEELLAHLTDLLSPHKRPRDLHFVDALPRNPMGKVMKNALG